MSAIFGALLSLLIVPNWLRWRRPTTFKLKPNCLLTKYPILFISGPTSIFYFGKFWNRVPDHLRVHGYEVYEIEVSWRNKEKRREEIKKYLQSFDTDENSFHLFVDDLTLSELGKPFFRHFSSVASLNSPSDVVPDTDSLKFDPWSAILWPGLMVHRWLLGLNGWKFSFDPKKIDALISKRVLLDRYLAKAITLAERDYLGFQK